MDKLLYRLRKLDKVVGFMQKTEQGVRYHFNTSMWWLGSLPEYDGIDEWTGFVDMNDNKIFELDILQIKDDVVKDDNKAVVLWRQQQFGLLFIESQKFMPLSIEEIPLFMNGQLKIVGYLYEDVELSKRLGINYLLK